MTTEETSARMNTLVQAMRDFEANPNDVGTVAWQDLSSALIRYEMTGDHDHSWPGKPKPILVGKPCPGGDCNVYRARKLLLHSLLRSLGLERE